MPANEHPAAKSPVAGEPGGAATSPGSTTAAQPRLWEPLRVYRKGERVIDRERDDVRHTEEGGIFEAVASFRAGYLNPRYVEKDRPGDFWKRVSA